MNDNKPNDLADRSRRHFLGVAAGTMAAVPLGVGTLCDAHAATKSAASVATPKPGKHTSFAPLKQVKAGVLNIGYAEAGPDCRHPFAWLAL